MVTKASNAKAAPQGKAAVADDALNAFTPVGIACFTHVWEPHSFDGKEPNYKLIIVFEPGTDITDLRKIVTNAAKKKFGDKFRTLAQQGKLALPFRDGSDYEQYGWPFDEEGAKFVSLSSRTAPGIVDARARPIIDQTQFYAGCRVRASVYAHGYDTNGNKGVTLLLNNLQKMSDGEPLGGQRMDASAEFGNAPGTEKGGDDGDDDLL